MTRDKALMNTLTVFTYLATYYPNEVINLTQYCCEMTLTIHSTKMTEQEIEDLSKQLDYLRIVGSEMRTRSHVSQYDGSTINSLEFIWKYDE